MPPPTAAHFHIWCTIVSPRLAPIKNARRSPLFPPRLLPRSTFEEWFASRRHYSIGTNKPIEHATQQTTKEDDLGQSLKDESGAPSPGRRSVGEETTSSKKDKTSTQPIPRHELLKEGDLEETFVRGEYLGTTIFPLPCHIPFQDVLIFVYLCFPSRQKGSGPGGQAINKKSISVGS